MSLGYTAVGETYGLRLATFYFVCRNDFKDTLGVAKRLRDDNDDLIHNAVGWMLREVGKRYQSVLEEFLPGHYRQMPCTVLRCTVGLFSEHRCKAYLHRIIWKETESINARTQRT